MNRPLSSELLTLAAEILHGSEAELRNIQILKKGMTNRSYLFTFHDQRYILRIPGEGTAALVNRQQEAEAYHAIQGLGICDDIEYINPDSGIKLCRFIENARTCDPYDKRDIARCMEKLRSFHSMARHVGSCFDIFSMIDFYEALRQDAPSLYPDYKQTKENILSIRPWLNEHAEAYVLSHIDANPDNFLFSPTDGNGEALHLIDWEYAAMQDPHVDIAMFCIYSDYSHREADCIIDLYFDHACPPLTRIKIYGYMSACGLLWSNWCEYKRSLGVDFGAYAAQQYAYAKRYYTYFIESLM